MDWCKYWRTVWGLFIKLNVFKKYSPHRTLTRSAKEPSLVDNGPRPSPPSRFPSGFALGKSLGSREIFRVSGMDFPIPPSSWWSTDTIWLLYTPHSKHPRVQICCRAHMTSKTMVRRGIESASTERYSHGLGQCNTDKLNMHPDQTYHPGLFPGASEAWKQQTRSLSPSHFEYHVRFSFPWCLCQGSPKSRVESAAGCGAVTEERGSVGCGSA